MEVIEVKELYKNSDKYFDKEISISGWVKNLRSSNAFGFIEVNDGSFFKTVQVVFDDKLDNFDKVSKLTLSSSIVVTGTFIKTENAKQPFEIHATNVEIINLSDSDYPIQNKRHTFEYLRTVAHLRPRTNTFSAVFRIRSVAAFAIHEYFQSHGYVYVNTPIIHVLTVKVQLKCLNLQH